MRFVTFEIGGKAQPGLVTGNQVIDLSGAGYTSLLELIERGHVGHESMAELKDTGPRNGTFPLSEIKLLAPIPNPRKFICVGLNYLDHAKETGAEVPKTPTIFNKFATAVTGHNSDIVLPKVSKEPDYEAELAFVIGKGGRHIPADKWQDHVFGYTIVNDISARDYQRATSQWLMGKTFDNFGPFGPWIVTADEITDPHKLNIELSINGETLQSSNTRELIFKIPDLIAFLSSVFTLEPGDIVSTGTPSGVGFSRKPPRYLQPGDETVVKIEGIGELRNKMIAET